MEYGIKNEGEIDLVDLGRVLFREKWKILSMIIIVALISIVISIIIPNKYRSTGFLVLSDDIVGMRANCRVSILEYRRYVRYYLQKNLFINYLRQQQPLPDEQLQKIISAVKLGKELKTYFTPNYAYSKADLKDISQNNSDMTNFVIGSTVRFENSKAKIAQILAKCLGDYFIRWIKKDKLVRLIDNEYLTSSAQIKSIENILLDYHFKMQQLVLKKNRLKKIKKKNPKSNNISIRKIISVGNGTQQFLSPIMQLVGIESSISDLLTSIENSRKQLDIAEKNLRYFAKAKKLMAEDKQMDVGIRDLAVLLTQVFNQEDLKNDNTKIVVNTVSTHLEDFLNYFKNYLRFIQEPNLSGANIGPKRIKIVIASSFLAFIFSILFILSLEWWKNLKSSDG
jgi:hypothetical protein